MNRDDLVRKVAQAVFSAQHPGMGMPYDNEDDDLKAECLRITEAAIDTYTATLLAEAADPNSEMVKAGQAAMVEVALGTYTEQTSAALVAGIKAVTE